MTSLPLFQKMRAASVALAWLAVADLTQAACPTTPGRFVACGAEVTDSQTGLVWQRCSAGQSWSGSTCTGSAGNYTHEQALAHAKTQNTTDSPTGWRLPNVKELGSLADRGCHRPAIDSTAFPATPPSTFYWTSSPFVGDGGRAWILDSVQGVVYYYNRNYNGAVRLVRASQ